MNSYDPISNVSKIILIVEFLLLAYMFYVLSTSLYKSYQVDNFIKQAEVENAKLEAENSLLEEDYEYYRSDAYKEKIAKQNFGLVRAGEEVIILVPEDKNSVSAGENAYGTARAYYNSLSNSQKWFLFFFERDRLGI